MKMTTKVLAVAAAACALAFVGCSKEKTDAEKLADTLSALSNSEATADDLTSALNDASNAYSDALKDVSNAYSDALKDASNAYNKELESAAADLNNALKGLGL